MVPRYAGQAWTVARFTVLEAVRTRLFIVFLCVLALAWLGGAFVRALAVTEGSRLQVVFLAGMLRWAAVFVISLYTISATVREFNDKTLELLLALDLPRAAYGFGKFLGFSIVAWGLAAFCGAGLSFSAPGEPLLAWSLSLAMELWMVVAMSLFCVATFSQVMPAAAVVVGFVLLGRSIGAIQLMTASPVLDAASPIHRAMSWTIDAIALLLPRLDTFTQSAWLVNESAAWPALPPLLAQSLITVALLLAAALFDLYRRDL